MLFDAHGVALRAATSFYEKNRQAIAGRWPEIARRLDFAPAVPYILSDTPDPVISIGGIQLASGFDREAEARCQADALDGGHCWVYGHGVGALPRELLQRGVSFTVVLLNLSVTRMVLETSDQTDWLSSLSVQLADGADEQRPREPFLSCHGEVRLCTADTAHLRDCLLRKLNEDFNKLFLVELGKLHENSVRVNERRGDADTCDLSNTACVPAVVVGGGPSLDGQWEWLQSFKGTIICASTSLIPLQRHDVTPHFVCTVDPQEHQQMHFSEIDERLADATLVYDLVTWPSIVEKWPGPRRTAAGLFFDGSVVHVAMDLAVRLGAPEVYLVGLDFCFPGSRSHAEGVTVTIEVAAGGQLQTLNGRGEVATTDPNLAHYHRTAEDFVARRPSIAWRKLGRDGVPMRGVSWLS